jgi:RES domain-containing protein
MRVYRIARQRWITNHDGSGVPNRWNKRGEKMLYTSSSLALAVLEMLVHLDPDQVPVYMWEAAEIRQEWVSDWDVPLIPPNPADVGSKWLGQPGGRLALAVPSVIVPEKNYLLNPNHTDFSAVNWVSPQELLLDPRLTQRTA